MDYLYAKVSAEIQAEPEQLWDIVADFAHHPQLAGSKEVQQVRPVTRGPVRVGYRVISNQRVAGVPYLTQSIVMKAERGRILYWMSGVNEFLAPNRWWFTFDKLPDGKTRVTHGYAFRPPLVSIFEPVISPFFAPRIDDNAAGMTRTLVNLAKQVGDDKPDNFTVEKSK